MRYPDRIREPVLHQWALNKTIHSRYDYPHVQPSENQLHIEFSVLATVNAITSVSVFFLILALLRSKRVRSKAFNLYLLFIAIPDFLAATLCLLTCALSAPDSRFVSEWMCGFQSFYLNWAFVSNAWLNAVIVYQIHKMLRHSNMRRRYTPPTHRQVILHALAVYAYAFLWGCLSGFQVKFLPYASHLYYGFACFPMEYDRASTFFFWIVYIPFLLGIPLIFVFYCVLDILRRKLMPPTGKRRNLSMFLLRLCFLYFGVWFPFIILAMVGNFVVITPLVHWLGAVISHFQGFLSAMFCLTNDDIRRSYYLVITCQPDSRKTATTERNSTLNRSSSGEEYSTERLSIRSRLFLWSHRHSLSAKATSLPPNEYRASRERENATAMDSLPFSPVEQPEERPSLMESSEFLEVPPVRAITTTNREVHRAYDEEDIVVAMEDDVPNGDNRLDDKQQSEMAPMNSV